MNEKDFLEEGGIDPKKLFNEKEYSTIIVNREGFSKKQNKVADLVYELLEKELSREETENIFKELKEGSAQPVLVEAIQNVKRNDDKARLCAACWESGLDFTSYFSFFAELSCTQDFLLAMEALTVVENIPGKITEEELKNVLVKAREAKNGNKDIIADLEENIKSRMA
jgi:SOS response regulatory protein OraA/RecX